MDETSKRLANLIGNRRGAKKELQIALGLKSQNTISDWLAGRSESYKKFLPRIAAHYNVSLDWLAGVDEEPAAAKDDELPELRKTLADLIRRFDSDEDFNRIKALSMLTPAELRKVLDYAELLLAARKE